MGPVFNSFLKGEDGAVTVDWVVLTAAIVGLGLVVVFPIAFSTDNAAKEVGADFAAWDKTYQKQN